MNRNILDEIEEITKLEWNNRGTNSLPQQKETADKTLALQFQGHPDHIAHFIDYIKQYQPPADVKLTPRIHRQTKG